MFSSVTYLVTVDTFWNAFSIITLKLIGVTAGKIRVVIPNFLLSIYILAPAWFRNLSVRKEIFWKRGLNALSLVVKFQFWNISFGKIQKH